MQRQRSTWVARTLGACVCAFVLGLAQASVALNAPDEGTEATATNPNQRSHAATQVADPHDPARAMHPLHVVAYAVHPVGVALDWVLVRPAVWVARHEPFRTLFGYED